MQDKPKNTFRVDFLGIGVPKAASSWISECLREHPEICFSQKKEVFFFARPDALSRISEYQRFFDHCETGKITGEYSPGYLYDKTARENIRKHNPNIRLIVCLRNPIERIISRYYYDKSLERTIAYSLEKYIQKDANHAASSGKYFEALQPWLRDFPSQNILIYEDIAHDPVGFIRDIFVFLRVNAEYSPLSAHVKINKTTKNRRRIPGLLTTIKKHESKCTFFLVRVFYKKLSTP